VNIRKCSLVDKLRDKHLNGSCEHRVQEPAQVASIRLLSLDQRTIAVEFPIPSYETNPFASMVRSTVWTDVYAR
jgi:hypothetical protein